MYVITKVYFHIKFSSYFLFLVIGIMNDILNQVLAWLLELILSMMCDLVCLHVYLSVCPLPQLLITSDMIWHYMDPA